MIGVHLVLFSLLLYTLLSERLFLRVSTGGRGMFPILDFCLIALCGLVLIASKRRRTLAITRCREFWIYLFPFILSTLLLPLFGICFNGYPVRSALESLQGVLIYSLLILGAWISSGGKQVWKTARAYLLFGILIEATLAVLQFGHGHSWLRGGLAEDINSWNINTQGAYSVRYVLTARSVGTYLNPNELGFWSVTVFWCSVFLFRGSSRVLGCTAAMVTLLCSQSRGSCFALIGSGALFVLLVLMSSKRTARQTRDRTAFTVTALLSVLVLAVILFQNQLAQVGSDNRFERGLRFLTEGTAADNNAAGRVAGWTHAVTFFTKHPLGTGGEPRYLFRDVIDNDFVRALLQGSVFHLTSLLLVLLGSFRLLSRLPDLTWTLPLCAAVISVDAMTAHPFSYPVIALFWLGTGFCLRTGGYSLYTVQPRLTQQYPNTSRALVRV